MPGKGEVWARTGPGREQILDRTVGCFAREEAIHTETERPKRSFEHVEHGAARGGDAFTSKKRRREGDDIEGLGGEEHGDDIAQARA
jgi:hypothetical protein